MELKGKKAVFLGDSITAGVGTSEERFVYWRQFAALTGAVAKGYGVSGTRIAPRHNKKPDTHPEYFTSRIADMDKDADIVAVFGGTNDFGHGDAPLGCIGDSTEETFYGALHVLCQELIERYPAAQLLFMTPTHRLTEDNESGVNDIGEKRRRTLLDYVQAIREVAECYGIPVLDLYKVSGIQPAVPVLRETYMPDGLHPSDAGNRRIAEKLAGFLGTL